MGLSRRHVLVALLASGLGALALWRMGRKAPEDTPSLERRPETSPREPAAPVASPPKERAHAPGPDRPPTPVETPPQPSLEERYPSPYADKPPAEERKLLEATVEHQEAMLNYAEKRLEDLEERADESDEAEDEYEQQLEAIREGRAQTEAYKQRLRKLNEELR